MIYIPDLCCLLYLLLQKQGNRIKVKLLCVYNNIWHHNGFNLMTLRLAHFLLINMSKETTTDLFMEG